MKINTNLSSLIVQNNLTKSTNGLNQAIERLTTGYKINHASDNAANYSISNNYESKISSLSVAMENTEMGLDMVTTAEDTLSELQNRGERLMELWTQAQNGTYGEQSLNAIQQEANAIVSEINRLYNNAEYNGIKLFSQTPYEIPDYMPKAQENGFILDPYTYDDEYVATLTKVSEVDSFENGQKYAIMTVDDLAKLAELVNSGNTGSGSEFILGADLDLEQYCAEHEDEGGWTAIGKIQKIGNTNDYSLSFRGVFDGNGHIISNLKINTTERYQGLFGATYSGAVVKNVGVVDVNIDATSSVGALIGFDSGNVNNCYSTGRIKGSGYVGGISGDNRGMSYCYSSCDIYDSSGTSGNGHGGIAGCAWGIIDNCYATGNVYSHGSAAGGLAGTSRNSIKNSYCTGLVEGGNNKVTGGLVGGLDTYNRNFSWENVISFSTVTCGTDSIVGNLVGKINIRNSDSFTVNNVRVLDNGYNMIGNVYKNEILDPDYDKSAWLANISTVELHDTTTTMQVGVNGSGSSQISFDSNFSYDLRWLDLTNKKAYSQIQNFLDVTSAKATELGAVSNRLQSAMESISVDIENLTSSLSTIKDADIAQVSSDYIKKQILQQASATLFATANQSPSIALQLI